jgi:KipI family sensor histidine kinase inhibitor
MGAAPPRFLDAGETALVVEFGATVDPAVNARVRALDAALRALALPGVVETVPTYRSLMIHYDPLVIDRESVAAAARGADTTPAPVAEPTTRWAIPCCYEPPFAEDLGGIAEVTGLTPDRIVALHSGAIYRIYMYGFAPGFCYLGGLATELAISRRIKPRPPHAPNALIIGGGLALVTTISMPTGWWVIGRTPERMFALGRDPVVFAEVGDELRFEPVDAALFEALEARAAAGEIVARRERR